MGRLIGVGLILLFAALTGCSKSDEEIKALEQEATKDESGAVLDSFTAAQDQAGATSEPAAAGGKSSVSSQTQDLSSASSEDTAQPMSAASEPAVSMPEVPPVSQAPDPNAAYLVIIGSYADSALAEAMAEKYTLREMPAFVRRADVNGRATFRLCLGGYATMAEAKTAGETVRDRYSVDFWIMRNQ
jgi:cell division septation protein DedD